MRKQPADAEQELERLEIAGQVITQLTADDEAAASEEAACTGSAQQAYRPCPPPAHPSSTASAASSTGALSPDCAQPRQGHHLAACAARPRPPAHHPLAFRAGCGFEVGGSRASRYATRKPGGGGGHAGDAPTTPARVGRFRLG